MRILLDVTGGLPDRIGRYEVRGTVGGGGMGDVYRVFDPVTRRELALKVLKFTYPRALHYFKREFRSVARLQHPNLVRLHDLHQEGGQYFFTMELIDGEDLYVYVNGHDRIITDPKVLCRPERVSRVRNAMIQLLRALAFMHDHQCIHRDIKPSNILVDTSGRVKVVDFGIVKELLPGGEGQSLSQVFGTSTYFSPEQSLGSRVTSATDTYAAGVVLYELLAGTPPFEGDSADVAAMHRDRQPPSLVARVPGVAPDLALVCMELLTKDPTQRPSAREALEMLDAEAEEGARSHDFVGRRGARRDLHLALEAVRRGEGRVALVEGPSGSGKSSLIEAFGQEARLFGASTFTGACVPRDHVELRGLDTVIERIAEAYRKQTARVLRRIPMAERAPLLSAFTFLAELLPMSEHGDPGAWSGGGLLGLSTLLRQLSEQRLLILGVEHVHLADDATFDVLETLVNEFPPILLVLSLRPEAVIPNSRAAAFFEVMRAMPERVSRIELRPFTLEETRSFMEEHLDDAPAWLVEHVQDQSGGVPLFVSELTAEIHKARARGAEGGAPTLDEIVTRRVSGLGEDARRVLGAITLSPRGVPGLVLERACQLDGDSLHAALDTLEMADLVRTEATSDGRQVAVPVHPDLLAAARRHLPSEEARAMHEMLARAYQASGGTAADLEYHWTVAGKPDRAPRFALKAAQEARSSGQHERAAELLALALKADLDPQDRTQVIVQLAESLTQAGRYLQAARALEALTFDVGIDSPQWRARKCQLYLMAGDIAAFDRAAQDLPDTARLTLADLLAPLDPERAEGMLADASGPVATLVRARLLVGRNSVRSVAEGRRLLEETLATVKRPNEGSARATLAIAEAVVRRAAGEQRLAVEVVDAALRDVRGGDLARLRLLLGKASLELDRGRVTEARGTGRELLREARARGLTGLQARACILQANVLLEAGLVRAADQLLDEAARCVPDSPVALPHLGLALGRVRRALYAGADDADAQLTDIERHPGLQPLLVRRAPYAAFATLRARLAIATGLRAWARGAGKPDLLALRELRRAGEALEQAIPKPVTALAEVAAVDALLTGRATEARKLLEQQLLAPGVTWDDPPAESRLWSLLATARELTGGDGAQARDAAQTLLREVGAAMSPEVRALESAGTPG